MKSLLICDEQFEHHQTGSRHPEGPDRIEVLRKGFEEFPNPPWTRVDPRKADVADLEILHPASYVRRVEEACHRQQSLDADTPVSAQSFDTARWAVGSALHLADQARRHRRVGFGAVRPPGHHAEFERGMGFCLFNNIGIVAEAMRNRDLRVAIVDIDVHHGNGTQKAFYDNPEVLYVSFHQYPFYPGTGAREETGTEEGRGYTVNIPLSAGSGWDRLQPAWEGEIAKALHDFGPDIILLSAGFDGHADDPLAGLNLTDEDYLRIARDLQSWADTLCSGRLMGLLEGGYNRQTLRRLVPSFVARLMSPCDEETGDSTR